MSELSIPFEIQLDLLKAKEEKGDWYVEGFCGSTEIDLQGDIITEDAFKKSEKDLLQNSTVLWNHDVNQVIGRVAETEARKEGLWVKVLISKTASDLWQRIKEGVVNKFSIRGKIIDAVRKFVKEVDKVANVINEMYLVEASLVSLPANPAAKTLRWYIEKSLNDYFAKGGEIPEIRNNIAKGDAMTELLDMLTKMSERLIADEDKAILETIKAKIAEKYPYPYPKKKSGEAYKQEEIDGLEIALEKAKKPKTVEELTEEEEKALVALVEEVKKAKADKYPAPCVAKKKSGEAYKQEEVDALEAELEKAKKPKKVEELTEEEMKALIDLSDEVRKQKKEKYPYPVDEEAKKTIEALEKAKKVVEEKIKSLEDEVKGLKADAEVEKRFKSVQHNFSESESTKVKAILKKSVLGEILTADETQSIAKMAPSSLFVGTSVESVMKNMDTVEKERLIDLGGIKTKIKKT
jgi:HK97 family phage prohead protease